MKLELHWQILVSMVLGAIIGIAVNSQLGTRTTSLEEGLPPGIVRATILDSNDLIRISWENSAGNQFESVVDPTGRTPGSHITIDDLTNATPEARKLYDLAPSYAYTVGAWCKRIGSLFLRLLQMISVPLIIASLSSGILGLGASRRFGRMFSTTIGYYLVTSVLAILTGLVITNILRPGINSELRLDAARAQVKSASIGETVINQIEALIPTNPFAAMASSAFLSIISFTIIFCIFVLKSGGQVHFRFQQLADDCFSVMMQLTTAIIRLAPIGVLLLMIYVTATQGAVVFRALAWYMLAVFLGLAIHACITLPLIVRIIAKRNPLEFARSMMPALLTAFSSASSNATLPITLNNIEQRAGVSNRISSFVLPLGSTINMDGTALYEAVAVLFIGQLALGGEFGIAEQIVVVLTALLASVGAAGIPHAGLVMMAIVLQAVNLPIEYQGIILAVDRVLDMLRTSVNVWSDCCGATVVERLVSSGETGDTYA
ncbi:MAG: dicarboxylate/amino acid:cation symporter [Planctomycetales bacterium]|nr:dicarboxylate/amino acid:cation symporter [Planctomycetales bacterium]